MRPNNKFAALLTGTSRKTASDDQIMALLRNESSFERGFGLLIAVYKERLYWHIRRMVQSHEDANDVLQNAFIKIYRGVQNFEGKSKLYTWLYRIATNESISFLQNRNRRQTSSLEDASNTSIYQPKADEWFDGDAVQQQLLKAIATLPEKQRVVFNMRYFEETPYEEMARILDTSPGALKASFHHAAKKIETYFKENTL